MSTRREAIQREALDRIRSLSLSVPMAHNDAESFHRDQVMSAIGIAQRAVDASQDGSWDGPPAIPFAGVCRLCSRAIQQVRPDLSLWDDADGNVLCAATGARYLRHEPVDPVGAALPRRVYLAARYDRRLEMVEHVHDLNDAGWIVTSRWLSGSHEGATEPATLARCAAEDLEDIISADTIVAFTEPSGVGGSGGRHIEFGYAMALRRRLMIVGHRENVFMHLPRIAFFRTWTEALAAFERMP